MTTTTTDQGSDGAGAGSGNGTDAGTGTGDGAPVELPLAGADAVAVVGVAADDVLNVRAGPGVGQEVVATAAPLATDLVVTGTGRQVGDAIWAPVEVDGTEGWVNASFLAVVGGTDDVTSQLQPMLDEDERTGSMRELGRAVAALRASDEPPSTVTVVAGPTTGDLGEVQVDVVGLGDDAVRGLRLHVFGEPDGAGGFTLRTVEETVLCARGATDDGRCT